MPEAHEHLEHAEHAEHAAGFSKKIALLIAVLALFLSLAEALGKSAQTEALDANVKSSDTWAFFQAKDIRRTVLTALADQTLLLASAQKDPAARAALDKQIAAWRTTAARYESDPQTGEGREQLAVQAREQEKSRDLALTRYHHYELASAAFQVGIVLASATVITGIVALAWLAGALGALGLVLMSFGLFAPNAVGLL